MLTIKEARKIQKERESKAILTFVFSLVFVALATYILLEYTNAFEISTAFYLIPIGIFGFSIKKTRIYLFFTKKEFTGKVVYNNVYVVKSQRVKGERSYMQYEGLEMEIIVQDDSKSKRITIPASFPVAAHISDGVTVSLLRFIDQPIIIEDNK